MTAGRVPVLLAVTGRPYEAALLAVLDRPAAGVALARRCLDLADLLAAASVEPSAVAVLAAGLHRLDAGAVARLQDGGVRIVGVAESDADAVRLADLGVRALVRAPAADDAHAVARFPSQVLAAVVAPAAAAAVPPPTTDEQPGAGTVVAVWGPTGAPGRTSVAVTLADELARAGVRALLADADTYGPSVAQRLGILDEASGVAAAVRLANAGRLDGAALADAARSLPSGLAVLTGLTRADRWPELPAPNLRRVWAVCRSVADVTVVDCGFCLEEDDELSYDAVVARRNAATLVTLESADVLVMVGSADVVGVTRLVRGWHELAELAGRRPGAVPTERRVVLTRGASPGRRTQGLARGLAAGDPDGLLDAALVVPEDPVAFARSVAQGRTLAEVAARSPAREVLRRLAEELRGAHLGSAGALGGGAGSGRGARGMAADGRAVRRRRAGGAAG